MDLLRWLWAVLFEAETAEEIWAALSFVAAAIIGGLAWGISRNQLELDLAPVLVPKRRNNKTRLKNVGRGVAFDVVALDPDGNAELIAAFLGPGESGEYRHARLNITQSHHVFYRNQRHHWFQASLIGSTFTGDEAEYPISVRVRRWRFARFRLPAAVQSKIRRKRSAEEHLRDQFLPYTPDFWKRLYRKYGFPRVRGAQRRWYGRGEETRKLRYAAHNQGFPQHQPSDDERRQWELDVSGISGGCWHTSVVEIEQYSCEHLSAGGIVCRLGLLSPFPNEPRVTGLVAVTAPLWSKIVNLPRSQRNDEVWRRLSKYICGLYPRDSFACELSE